MLKSQGYEVYDRLIDPRFHGAMLQEARTLASQAVPVHLADGVADDERGGDPPRDLLQVGGDLVQDELYHCHWLGDFLRQRTGRSVVPTGPRGTYSYYNRAGDYISLHRDLRGCDLTLIHLLTDNPDVGPSGRLCIYPSRNGEAISRIRETQERGAQYLNMQPGHTLIFYGGQVAHRLEPVLAGQERIISVLCFEVT